MIDVQLLKNTEKGDIFSYHFQNNDHVEMTVTNYGGIIMSIKAPDRKGKVEEVTLGFDGIDGYFGPHPYFGSTVGRFANRIKGGRFVLDGKEYSLYCNNGKNHLHGGREGFDKKIWKGSVEGDTLALFYVSADGEEGYPGRVEVEVRFSLTEENAAVIEYIAQSDADTVLNLTNHTYFNLDGRMDSMLDQTLAIYADKVTETDGELMPTGELRDVAGTPLDFRTPHKIGGRIKEEYDLLNSAGGYDFNYVLTGKGMRKAAEVYDESTGRQMEVYTDQPGVQLYTSQLLGRGIIGHGGKEYVPYCAFCLETQHFPDAPNQPAFPSTLLKKGEAFCSVTKYVFSAK